ncbi:MAG: proteasome subunit alpha, partial [Acidimicrobiales bacterium]
LYDGSVADEDRFTVLGGDSDTIAERMKSSWRPDWPMDEALRAAVAALAGPDRSLGATELEVAVLSRGNGRRAFRRIVDADLVAALGGAPGEDGERETAGKPSRG